MQSRHLVQPHWIRIDESMTNVSIFARTPPAHRPIARCPLCDEVVTLKLGDVRVHHYAHRAGSTCAASQPETALHLNCKSYLGSILQAVDELRIWESCACCVQRRPIVWTSGWDTVEVEYRLDTVRPDILLVANGRPQAALEICVTHAVDDVKAARLAALNIPWLEVQGDPTLYEAPAWSPDKPLAYKKRGPVSMPWMCAQCITRQSLRTPNEHSEIYVATMIDRYYASGKKFRAVFYISRTIIDGVCVAAWLHDESDRQLAVMRDIDGLETTAIESMQESLADYLRRSVAQISDIVVPWRRWVRGQKFLAKATDRWPFRYSWHEQTRQWVSLGR